MTPQTLLLAAPLLALLAWAAVEDLRRRRIPNWLTAGLIFGGLLQSWGNPATLTPAQSFLGLLAGLGLPMLLFAIDAIGGADVKLLCGIGAWLGASVVFEVFMIAAIIGMLIVLAQALWQRRLFTFLRNSAVLAINLVHLKDVGVEHVRATGLSSRSVERPLPYAVPVLLAMILVIATAW